MDASQLPVSLTFIAICTALLLPMTGWIGLYRGGAGILRGDGGDPVLFKRSRIHGSFIENAPLTALALTGAELTGLGAPWLWLAIGSFFAGRVIHYMLYDRSTRAIGMMFTTAPGLLLGFWIVVKLWVR